MSTLKAAKPKHTTHPVLGQLPAGWKAVKLKDCCTICGDYGLNAAAEPFADSKHRYLRITDIDEHGRLLGAEPVSTSHPDAHHYLLKEGDILFARTGASVGKSYTYRVADGPLVYAGFLVRFRPDPSILDVHYLEIFTSTQHYWRWVEMMSARSGQPGINGAEYGQLPIPLPPLTEQRRIAGILGTWDKAIALLGQQIAAKEERLRGLIDQLVSGQRHGAKEGKLPKGWRWVRLGELGTFSKGKGVLKTDIGAEGVPVVTYGELYTVHHVRIKRFHSFVNEAVAARSQPIECNDVLFAGSGETAAEIGKAAVYLGSEHACAGGDVIILRTNRINALYLATALNSSIADRQRLKLGQGHSVVHIYPSQLAGLKVPVPPEEVQDFIASATTSLDDELDLLRTKLEQLQEQKRGLMQQLLRSNHLNATNHG